MTRNLVFVLIAFTLLSPLLHVRFNPPVIESIDEYRVHNLNTGLNYSTIQEAIDAPETLDGHSIFVEEGRYYEHVLVHKSLSLIGENRSITIVDGNRTGSVFSVTAQNVSLSGFTIVNAGFKAPMSGAILLNQTTNCVIENVATLDSNPCGIALVNSTHNKISTSESFNNTFDGFLLVNSNENTIDHNVISRNQYGIGLGGPKGSSNNILADNQISDNVYHGVDIFGFHNKVSSNQIFDNSNGVLLDMARDNLIIDNNISNNSLYGVYLIRGSENNTIIENRIQSNSYGLYAESSSGNNSLYHNNLIGNTIQVLTSFSSNTWDNELEGNYWSSYSGVDLNHDGIGDTRYAIDANNIDHYPLMGMFSSFHTSLGYYVKVISNSTIQDFSYFPSNGTIQMHVSNLKANQTFGFCRISIPHALISPPYKVSIDGANPIYWNYTLYDNGTNRWIYFAYEYSTKEIIIVLEFPSIIIFPLFMLATLAVVIVYRRKHLVQKLEF
jgi:nitrous oxidase accessory protein